MISFLLCGEGSTDYGEPQYESNDWNEGTVQPIIRKIVDSKIDIKFYCIKREELKSKRNKRQRSIKGLKEHGVKAYKLCNIAKEKDIKNIICYVDCDKDSSGKSEKDVRNRFDKLYSEIKEGFDAFNKKDMLYKISGIPMIPVKMIESWLLYNLRLISANIFP